MGVLKKYKQWQDVPKQMQDAYKHKRWTVVIPRTVLFKVESIDWSRVDWVNYVSMKGRMWDKKGKEIKL